MNLAPDKPVISGLVEVSIFGVNLGRSRRDITAIYLHENILCGSILYLGSDHLRCTVPRNLEELQLPTPSEVRGEDSPSEVIYRPYSDLQIRILFRSQPAAQGVRLDAPTVRLTGGRAPAIERVVLRERDFLPYALTFHRDSDAHLQVEVDSTGVEVEGTLYWSNVAESSVSIQRSTITGDHLETVLSNVKK